MPAASGAPVPYWLARDARPSRPPVDADADFDVVVVGGGLTGLTAGYLLKRAGLRVALVEGGRCATGDSGQTSAHLTYVSDKPLSALVADVGVERARAFWDGGRTGLQTIGDIVAHERIDCDFCWVTAYLHLPQVNDVDPDERERLVADAELAADLGFDATFVERAPLVYRPAIRFERQARFEPLRYAQTLIGLIDGEGSAVFESSPVTEIITEPLSAAVCGHYLRCRDIVIATHLPTVAQPALVHAAWGEDALALFTSYVIAADVSKGKTPDALLWDTADPYRYLRIVPGASSDVVIFGGHDHRVDDPRDPEECYVRLERDLARLVPDARTSYRWSGEVIISSDGLPVIGFAAPYQFVATGFNGNGITLGTLAGLMAAAELSGHPSPWREVFAVDRPALHERVGRSLTGNS